MPVMLDEKVQIDILDEVNEKSDGIKHVELDLNDPCRKLNFDLLCSDGFFNGVIIDPEYDPVFGISKTGITGLSDKGYKYRAKLVAELENTEHLHRQTEAFETSSREAKEANRIARSAKRWSIAAAILSAVAVLIAAALPFILSGVIWLLKD